MFFKKLLAIKVIWHFYLTGFLSFSFIKIGLIYNRNRYDFI